MSRATYACTALVGTNKSGILKPTEDGWYPMVLGALDVYNSIGAFYPYETAKHVFEQSSSLMRRIANGACRAEYGHPKMMPGMTEQDFIRRILTIEEKNVCAIIRNVTIDCTSIRDAKTGRPVIAIIGEVKPEGPYGHVLKEQLDNPHSNVAFSIRSLTEDVYIGPTLHKNIKIVVCWDYVNEPGISVATKYHAPSLEAITDERVFYASHFGNIRDYAGTAGVSLESEATTVSVESVIEEFGWDKTEQEKKEAKLPGSFRW